VRAAQLGLLGLLTACYSPSVREGVACGAQDACPTGQRCFAGTCWVVAPEDAGNPDTALVDASLDAAIDAMPDAMVSCGHPTADTITAPCAGTFSSQAHYFDIEAKAASISITGFDTLSQNVGSRTVSLYTKSGTHVGSETNASAWTLLGSTTYTPGGGGTCPVTPSAMPITFCVDIPAGQRAAFYYVMTTGTGSYETVAATADSVVVQDSFLALHAGSMRQGVGAAFSAAATSGHAWQGVIHYQH